MESTEQKQLDEEKIARNTNITIQITGAALFGALSIVLSLFAPVLPRFPNPQGIAYFDPVSIAWILCFLIFGPYAGMLCSFIGFIGLIPLDQSLPVIGPFMKFAATIPLIVIPTLVLKLYRREEGVLKSRKMKNLKNYILTGLIAVAVREVVMILLNIAVFLSFFGPTGLGVWVAVIAIINPFQSIWDLAIPYLVVFRTKLDTKFEIW
jgi:riboflavin transporter FmnP